MDPFLALSIASSVAQFIDFGCKLIQGTKEIAEAGSTISVVHLSDITSDLIGINSSLEEQLIAKGAGQDGDDLLSKEQLALYELTERCNEVANEIISCLKKVTVNSDKKQRWENVRKALKTIWSKNHLETLAKRLGEYRGQLTLRLLLALNTYYAKHDEKLDSLQRVGDEIVEIVSINCRNLKSIVEEQHAETISAILTTRGGKSRSIAGPQYGLDFHQQKSNADVLKTATTYRQAVPADSAETGAYANSVETGASADFETRGLPDYTTQILDGLHFRGIAHRRATIAQAHKKTFEWVFHQSESKGKRWDNLREWLESGTGCYWISGKAGSGKSSLMKYLQEDRKTFDALHKWAGPSELVLGSFYFWYAGTTLQKSQTGLLRSLLFDVLHRRPEMATVLFPDVCRSIISGQLQGKVELSLIELHMAFAKLTKTVSEHFKICFIIDGIDEYIGDHNEICELFAQASTSESIKVLLSSRPIPVCVYAFSKCPKLRLQDLTFNDIRHYVRDKLAAHPLMERLEEVENGVTAQLISSVTSKASGVFLWVILAVRQLILGLQNYDTVSDLSSELEQLPPDLEKLYDHMLGSMSVHNRRLGSKFLQLVLRSSETQGDYPMTVLQLSFAEEEDYMKAVNAPLQVLSEKEEHWRCEATEGRIRSRCCGLLEVHEQESQFEQGKAGNTVGFLHRTVVEFLQTDTVWSQLVSLTVGTKFDVDLALMSSSLAEMKARPIGPLEPHKMPSALLSMLRMLTYEKNMESPRDVFHKTYLPELRNTMGYHWHNNKLFNSPEAEIAAVTAASNRACKRLKLSYPHTFVLSVGIQNPDTRLYSMFRQASILENGDTPHHAAYLMIQYTEEFHASTRASIAQNIMAPGLAPNASICLPRHLEKLWNSRWKDALHPHGTFNWSLWEYFLHYVCSITITSQNSFIDCGDASLSSSVFAIIISMLEQGADAHACISLASKPHGKTWVENREISAFALLRELMTIIWAAHSSSKASSGLTYMIAKQACVIEDTMTSQKAVISDKRSPRGVENASKDIQRSKIHQRRRPITPLKNLSGETKPTTAAKEEQPKKTREPSKAAQDIALPSGSQQTRISPWRRYKERADKRNSQPTLTQLNSDGSREIHELRLQKQWQSTPRNRRLELLNVDEQKLAADLSHAETAQEKRSALSRMYRLPAERQAQILECSKFI